MANAKISMPGGLSVEVDGTPDEIIAVVESLKAKLTRRVQEHGIDSRRGEIAGLINQLKSEEFFKSPRGLSDLRKKLGEIGHHYPLTTLSGAMQTQSRKRNLRRFKKDGKYVYVQ
jgi:hypothetical protein